ncbi:MAG: ferrous iron transport protein B [Anaerolineaceae bacterium]|nr:ferrous iron transport protein B [Anaerolineaceae bacterium]
MTHEHAYTKREKFQIDYGRETEDEIVKLQNIIAKNPDILSLFPSRWLAIKLLEQDEEITNKLQILQGGENLLQAAEESTLHLSDIFGDEVDTIIADHRYGWINGLMRETVKMTHSNRVTISDRIDDIVTNRVFGIPIFFIFMWIVFKFTTDVTSPYIDWIANTINGPITNWITAILNLLGFGSSWVESLLVDGIIAGVGGVMVFIPTLMSLYMVLAVLEDSGYMARAAFVMDRFMHMLGLHGKSFLPMIVGFGCSVPAIYATRTLENRKDRILTGLLVPFISCSARLPTYVLFAAIFFPENAGAVVFWMYATGIVVAVLVGLALKNTVFRQKELSLFVLELPPYHMPTLKSIWFSTWERTSSFVRKAGSVILGSSVVIWLLLAIPINGGGSFANTTISSSAFADVSDLITPVFKLTGFGTWQNSGALISGIVAKELIVSTLSQVYFVEEEKIDFQGTTFFDDLGDVGVGFIAATRDTIKSIPLIIGINPFYETEETEAGSLKKTIQNIFYETSGGHGKLAALAFLVFVLTYTPCLPTMAAIRHELGSKWMLFSAFNQLAIAWLLAVIIFQGGKLLGLG